MRSVNEADGPAPPQPEGQPGIAAEDFVVRRQRPPGPGSSSLLVFGSQDPAARPTGVLLHPARHNRPSRKALATALVRDSTWASGRSRWTTRCCVSRQRRRGLSGAGAMSRQLHLARCPGVLGGSVGRARGTGRGPSGRVRRRRRRERPLRASIARPGGLLDEVAVGPAHSASVLWSSSSITGRQTGRDVARAAANPFDATCRATPSTSTTLGAAVRSPRLPDALMLPHRRRTPSAMASISSASLAISRRSSMLPTRIACCSLPSPPSGFVVDTLLAPVVLCGVHRWLPLCRAGKIRELPAPSLQRRPDAQVPPSSARRIEARPWPSLDANGSNPTHHRPREASAPDSILSSACRWQQPESRRCSGSPEERVDLWTARRAGARRFGGGEFQLDPTGGAEVLGEHRRISHVVISLVLRSTAQTTSLIA